MLDRRVQELLHLGEGDDLVELAPDLAPAHPDDRAVEVDVLPAGQVGVKARPDFEQAPQPPVDVHLAGGRPDDAREDFEQRALARPVTADDADDFAREHLEAHVPERPDDLVPPRSLPATLRGPAEPVTLTQI